ncbi:MAG: glycosyltransferase family 2 protein, partial [Desulfobulbaceae bacterium]|nr:glycosyltransferase family 2 protein [Desulfobulbaceae bacterium]
RSVEMALQHGARVAHQTKVKGYGAAIKAAIAEAEGDYLIMADADDSYDWENIKPFLNMLEKGSDFVIGNRFQGRIHAGAMPFLHRYLGNPVLSAISRLCYNIDVGDFHCGMRTFTRKAYEQMNLRTDGMEFATEMVVRAAHEKMKITEVPIDLFPDKRSRPPHLRTFRDGWRHLRFIMTYAPNYLYMTPGCILFAIGMILQLFLVQGPIEFKNLYMGPHFLALGLLLTLVGYNIINLGVVAKVVMVRDTPLLRKKMFYWLTRYFSLERGLIVGSLLAVGGLTIDMSLLARWLFSAQESMEDTVHLAFVGTGLIAIGFNIIFSSFLLGMLINDNLTDS